MRFRLACSLALLVSCTGVHVDNLTVDDPTVNIDANADVNIDANATANVDVKAPDTGSAQPSDEMKPVEGVTAPALRQPETKGEAKVDVVEPEPCADSDSDGVCDEADTCPAGSDADADGTGYADGCERELWSTTVWVSPSPNTLADRYQAGLSAIVALTPWRDSECMTESEGAGMVAIELPQHYGDESLVVRMARPDTNRGATMVGCLEAGVESTIAAGLKGLTGGYSSAFTDTLPLPEGSTGAHIVYFEVHLDEYVTIPAAPYGTMVTAFRAVVSARGY